MNPVNVKVPQELFDLYTSLVKGTDDPAQAAQHLQNFLDDAKAVVLAVQTVVDMARQRAGQ